MDPIQPLARHLVFPLLRWKNRNGDLKYITETERAQYLPAAELARRQLEQLRRLLLHAGANCPFYAERFSAVGFDPAALTSLTELRRLPLLARSDVQRHRAALVARNLPEEDRIENQTGGSSGSPVKFFLSRDSRYRRIAATLRHDRWAGLEPYHKAAAIWGHPRDLQAQQSLSDRIRDSLYCRRVICDAGAITEGTLSEFVDRLDRERPTTYVAYANAIFLLARYIRQRQLAHYHHPRSIITSAEVLTAEQRQLIEEVFGARVFNRYGSREFSVIASECEQHRGMHIAADRLLVEVVRGERACRPGEVGEIVITDLYNDAMPFIRYRIGDIGMLLDGDCTCGRTLPRMEVVGGRVTDFIVTPEGTAVSGAAMTIHFVARVPGIAQAQLVQKARDHVVLRLVADPAFGEESRRMIAAEGVRFFGPHMRLEIEPVDVIPAETSGKHRFSISEIDPLEYLR